MELAEPINSINNQLKDHFGTDSDTGRVIWRIVFSEDQYEMRLGTYTDYSPGGIYLRTVTEVRLAPKYKQWIHEKFILERLVVIPVQQLNDLPTSKVSYEPIWTFEDKNGNYLPPKFEACKFIIDTIYAAQYENHSLAKYADPIQSAEDDIASRKATVDGLVEELFGDESSLMGTTIDCGSSIIVPHPMIKEN